VQTQILAGDRSDLKGLLDLADIIEARLAAQQAAAEESPTGQPKSRRTTTKRGPGTE